MTKKGKGDEWNKVYFLLNGFLLENFQDEDTSLFNLVTAIEKIYKEGGEKDE